MEPEDRKDVTDSAPLFTEAIWREMAALKELFLTRTDSIEKSIEVAHENLVRIPTETQKAVAALKELQDAKIDGNRTECKNQFKAAEQASLLVRSIIETRLNGNDTAIKLLQDTTDKFPARIDEKIVALKEVHQEKFESIQLQFLERDVRTEQSAQSTKTAVDAALAAQEKSFGKQGETFSASTAKTEESFTKQIDQLGALLQSAVKSLEDKISDLKDRFNRGEGRSEGIDKQVVVQNTADNKNQWLIGIIIGIIMAAAVTGINLALR
jgi:hypothetical protein